MQSLPVVVGILVGAVLATIGWIYTARRARNLSRRQHTFNALLTVSCNLEYQQSSNRLRPLVRAKSIPDVPLEGESELRDDLTLLLNHFEFLAAGLRNGDISERLLRDSERGTIIGLVEASEAFIQKVRDTRHRQSIFEHVEWLHRRWKDSPPVWWQQIIEQVIGHPLRYDSHRWWWLGGVALALLALVVLWIHIPPAPISN